MVAELLKCFFIYQIYLIANGLIIAGHTYKYCGLGALIHLLGLHLNVSQGAKYYCLCGNKGERSPEPSTEQ